MRIELERTGGFAGTTVHVEVETGELADGARLEALARSALRQPLARTPGGADHFTYLLRVDEQQQRCGEHDLCGARADLVEQLLALRRHRPA